MEKENLLVPSTSSGYGTVPSVCESSAAVSENNAESTAGPLEPQRKICKDDADLLVGETAAGPFKSMGNKADDGAKQMMSVCFYICGMELFERTVFYTLYGTLAFYLERRGDSLESASATVASMSTLSFLWTIIAGWIADAWLGRYSTVALATALYVVGSLATTLAAYPTIESKPLYMIGTLGIVPFATAGVKATLAVFGADQFDSSSPQGAAAQQEFFSWFFVSINAGAIVAYAFMVNYGDNGGLGVPQEFGYFSIYLAATCLMIVGLIVFVAGRNTYVYVPMPAKGSSLKILLEPIALAAKNGCVQAICVLLGFSAIIVGLLLSVANGQMAMRTSAAVTLVGFCALLAFCSKPYWVDRALSHRELQEEPNTFVDTKALLKLIPVCLTSQIAGLTAQTVMSVWYANQACQMDVRIFAGHDSSPVELSGAFFNIADCLAIIILTPVVLSWVDPAIERLIGRPLDYADKIYIGTALGMLSILAAAKLEIVRRSREQLALSANCGPDDSRMSDISAFWICIPYVLTGMSEIYVMPTVLYIAYEKSPKSMRTFATMIVYFVLAVISQIVSLITHLMSRFITDDLNQGHLEYVYFAYVGVAFTAVILFTCVDITFRQEGGTSASPPSV